jgi:two-component system response regulator HydG
MIEPRNVPAARILLVDDDPQSLDSTRKILELAGYEVAIACDGQVALELVRACKPNEAFDLVVSDVRMPRLGGLEFLRALSLCGDTVPVILMTAFGRVEDAVWAMKLGAVDFLTKPFKRQALLAAVEAALARVRAQGGKKAEIAASEPILDSKLIGRSQRMNDLRAMILQVAPTAATVLLTGESGTGKEMVARAIHEGSPRSRARFIALNCAAVPEQLIESELFGFDKGAFTGATGSKEGLFEAANHGTLLLDEIGDMPFPLQAKLLRTLQESEVRRLGSTYSRKIDVRVIAATHRDLKEAVRIGTFRQDLLYRLEVIGVEVPRLRDRMEDVPMLARYFLAAASERHEKKLAGFAPDVLDRLMAHTWPGNVRELGNVVERAVVFARGEQVALDDLPAHLVGLMPRAPVSAPATGAISVPFGTPLKDVEELMIRKTLEATSGDKNMTAKLLGINSRTIYRKLAEERGGEREGERDPES